MVDPIFRKTPTGVSMCFSQTPTWTKPRSTTLVTPAYRGFRSNYASETDKEVTSDLISLDQVSLICGAVAVGSIGS